MLVVWYNSILHTGVLPQDWKDVLMVLLPKIKSPQRAKDTRPMSVAVAAEKALCRIVLERSKRFLQLCEPWQCSGCHRQCCDYLHSVHKLMELDRIWGRGICVLKVYFARAFDSVSRSKLLHRLHERLGETEEFRLWQNLMIGTSSTLRSPWGQSTFNTSVGIRQVQSRAPCSLALS